MMSTLLFFDASHNKKLYKNMKRDRSFLVISISL